MKLATNVAVLTKMGVSTSIQDNLDSADAALDFATVDLETALDTKLEEADIQDFFSFLPSIYETSASYSPLRLLCSRAFWQGAPKVYYSNDGTAVTKPDALLLVDSADYVYDPVQGTIYLLQPPYIGHHTFMVSYSAGFAEGSSEIPTWLSQAAVGYAIQNMHAHVAGFNRKDARDKTRAIVMQSQSSVAGNRRTRNGQVPAFSKVV